MKNTEIKPLANHREFDKASLYITCEEKNGAIYWYGYDDSKLKTVTTKTKRGCGRISKTSGNPWARISKKVAAEILAGYGITLEQFIAYTNEEPELMRELEAQIAEEERKELCDFYMSAPLTSNDAFKTAVEAEIELAISNTNDADAEIENGELNDIDEEIATEPAVEDYNESLKPTAKQTEEARKASAQYKAELKAQGIRFIATVSCYPHGIEGEDMQFFSRNCKSFAEVIEFTTAEVIEGKYVGGIYEAGVRVKDIDGNEIDMMADTDDALIAKYDNVEPAEPAEIELANTNNQIETAIFPLLFTDEEIINSKRHGLPFYKVAANKANVDIEDRKIGGKWQGGLVIDTTVTGTREGIQKFKELVSDRLKHETDDFNAQIAALKAEHNHAQKLCDEKREALRKAQEEYNRAVAYEQQTEQNLNKFGDAKARELRNELVTNDITDCPELTLNTQDNCTYDDKLKTFGIFFINGKFVLTVDKEASLITRHLAIYDTPAQVQKVIGELKAAIKRGDSEFYFPTFDEPTPDEMLNMIEDLDRINSAAPDGWQVEYNGKDFTVKYRDSRVVEIDSLALGKILPPDNKFFDRFKSLAPYVDDARPQFTEDLYREIDELKEMREQLTNDAERIKIIDGLIEDAKRKIVQLEIIEYDDNGEPIPCF